MNENAIGSDAYRAPNIYYSAFNIIVMKHRVAIEFYESSENGMYLHKIVSPLFYSVVTSFHSIHDNILEAITHTILWPTNIIRYITLHYNTLNYIYSMYSMS